jgi:hypothetical protein
MTTPSALMLIEQRRLLRDQLLAQRQVIKRQLEPEVRSGYPRSMTMRFLTQRSVPAAKVIGGFTVLLLGLRFFKTMTTTVGVIKAVRSVAGIGRK